MTGKEQTRTGNWLSIKSFHRRRSGVSSDGANGTGHRAPVHNAAKLPPIISASVTTEKGEGSNILFNKSASGDGRYPTQRDIEREAGLTSSNTTTEQAYEGVLELTHSWKQHTRAGNLTATVTTIGRPKGGSNGTEGRTIWLHIKDQTPSIDRFKENFNTKLTNFNFLQPFSGITVDSVLKRLRVLKERKFVHGRFLEPGLIRYNADSTLTGFKDNPCLFLNFPYLAVGNFTGTALEDENLHPVRTLLQWRYRLKSTLKQDLLQSLVNLKPEIILEAAGLEKSAANIERLKKELKINVPQLWSMSVSGDILMTMGPLSPDALYGDFLEVRNIEGCAPVNRSKTSMIRFVCEVERGSRMIFLFIAETCKSYYALLDRKDKVEVTLGIKPEGKPNEVTYDLVYRATDMDDDDDADDGGDGGGETVTSTNWCRIIRLHKTNCLDLWLQPLTPQGDATGSDNDSMSQTSSSTGSNASQFMLEYLNETPGADSRSGRTSHRSNSPRRGPLSLIEPFLTWNFREDPLGKKLSESYKVNLWQTKIFRSIYRKYGVNIDKRLKPVAGLRQPSGSLQTLHPPVDGRTSEAVNEMVKEDSRRPTTKEEMWKECQSLFTGSRDLIGLWIPAKTYPALPETHNRPFNAQTHSLSSLYWGLVSRIIDYGFEEHLSAEALYVLWDQLQNAQNWARDIHEGVWVDRMTSSDGTTTPTPIGRDDEVVYIQTAFVQLPLMDAWEHIINVLFKVVKCLASKSKTEPLEKDDMAKLIKKRFEKYKSCLQDARRNLISDTDEPKDQQSLGPIVTPEAITILLLGRLSKGLYHNGTIDFIDLYEKIVEQVASKIENHFSRFLLVEINQIQEEIEILLQIYHEQKAFLEQYSFYLNPKNIPNHTKRRQAAFPLEEAAIKRICRDVEERIEDCKELLEQIKSIAVKNLQYVESYQDDNNRRLMVFTIVNIVFLPLSFVAGLMSMNVPEGVSSFYTAGHFWWVAIPLTFVVVVLSTLVLCWKRLTLALSGARRKIRA